MDLTFIQENLDKPAVLHVPYTYFPDACGGTEVYVRGLAQRLASRGYPSAVAAPSIEASEYANDGLLVYRFASDQGRRLELAYGVADETAAEGFRAVVRKTRPRIVHLHARTSAVSELLIDAAHDAGAAVIFTYHTPTVSCARGTMMLFGQQRCDGVIKPKRCTTCTLVAHGAPKSIARVAALTPNIFAAGSEALADNPKWLSFLRVPALIASGHRRFNDFVRKVDHIVAVCQWVREVLEQNGVPPEMITLSRHGLSQAVPCSLPRSKRETLGQLRIAYFGRIDRAKGPDLLARALKKIPNVPVQIDIFGITQFAGPNRVYDFLAAHARQDPRLTLRTAVLSDKVVGVMAEYDLVAVPSRWLETGPLVALEAFAAGVPVLGADVGGIAELVQDGINGVLVPPDDDAAWASAIASLAENRHLIQQMCGRITEPRSMEAVTDDMAAIYSAVVAGRAIQSSQREA